MSAKSRSAQYPLSAGTIPLLAILLLASALRFHRLDAQSLWNDEGTSVALAQRDLVTITQDAAGDIHPPLYYWLLHGWVRLVGTSEVGVRSLSALLGVILVMLTYLLGRLLAGRWAGLMASFLAAVTPFQIYYSQEARMYMLLAVLTAGAMLVLVHLLERGTIPAWIALVLLEAAGLYTHYAFAFVILVLNLALGLCLALTWRKASLVRQGLSWVLSQVAVVLIFLPWLPTAIQQVSTWPRAGQPVDLVAAVAAVGQLLLVGPAAPPFMESVAIFLLLVVTFLPLGHSNRLPAWVSGVLLVLWLVVPVGLILGLGLFKEAYFKFLLVVSPAYCLLVGRLFTASLWRERVFRSLNILLGIVVAAFLVYASAFGLCSYYTDPAYARDDYRGISAYVDAIGRPGDAVLLNAPGQQEVFGYYYDGDLPVYPLPESRPLERAATESALEALAQPGGRVFAVLWATDESDPERFVEGWLDAHAYKALDSWVGNVRLAVYAVPEQTPDAPGSVLNVHLHSRENDDEVVLLGYSLLDDRLAAGDIAPITLFWQVERTPARRYKVFLHVLDAGNHIVGQRDTEPGGGARLTTLWQPGEMVVDNHGVPIHPATPPGEYRVEVGLYDAETGQRLLTPEDEGQVWLALLAVERPLVLAPVAALGMQNDAAVGFGELALLGYDICKLGFACGVPLPRRCPGGQAGEDPGGVPLLAGDVLHINLYWRAEAQPGGDWQVEVVLLGSNGEERAGLVVDPVGDYPTSRWRANDVWRGQFNLAIPGDAPPGRYRVRIQPIAPNGSVLEPFLSEPLDVGP